MNRCICTDGYDERKLPDTMRNSKLQSIVDPRRAVSYNDVHFVQTNIEVDIDFTELPNAKYCDWIETARFLGLLNTMAHHVQVLSTYTRPRINTPAKCISKLQLRRYIGPLFNTENTQLPGEITDEIIKQLNNTPRWVELRHNFVEIMFMIRSIFTHISRFCIS